MSLFANQREANLESTVAMIEDVLIELGHFLNNCRSERPASTFAWTIRKGSASINIDLLEHPSVWRIRASGVVLTITENVDRLALFEKLLTLNATKIAGAAFAIEGDRVLLLAERSTIDLDRSEVRHLIDVVQTFADEYDDQLVAEFGGTMGRS